MEIFDEKLLALIDKHAPLKTIELKGRDSPWLTPEIKQLLCKRNKMRRKCLQSKEELHLSEYKRLRNNVKQVIRNAQIKYYHTLFENIGNSSKMWSNITSLGIGNNKNSVSPTDTYPVNADQLNYHYLNVGNIADKNVIDETINKYDRAPPVKHECFDFKYAYPEDIHEGYVQSNPNQLVLMAYPYSLLYSVFSLLPQCIL